MQINPVGKMMGVASPVKAAERKGCEQDSFGQVLKKTLHGKVLDQNISVLAPERPPSIMLPMGSDDRLFATMERSFENLSQYQKMLGNGKVSLRAMESVVGLLKEDATDLKLLLDEIGDEATIKPLISETAILLAKEIARYERGEYLD